MSWKDVLKIEPYEVAVAEQFAPEELTNEKRTEAMAATIKQQIEEASYFTRTYNNIAFWDGIRKLDGFWDIHYKSLNEEINTIDEYVKEILKILIPRKRKTLTKGEAKTLKTLLVKGEFWKSLVEEEKELKQQAKEEERLRNEQAKDEEERGRLNISESQHQNLKNLRSAFNNEGD